MSTLDANNILAPAVADPAVDPASPSPLPPLPPSLAGAFIVRDSLPGGGQDSLAIQRPGLTPRVPPGPVITLPSVFFNSPQPGQVFSTSGLVRISVNTSQATRLDFFAKQVGGPGLVFLRTAGPTGIGTTTTQFDVPASQIPFPSAVIQLDLYSSSFSTFPYQAFSGQFFLQPQPAGSTAVTFTSPQGGEVWSCNQVQTVTWQFDGDVLRWEIAYSLNGGPFVTVNNNIPGLDRLYFFFPPFVVSNTPTRLRLRKVASNGSVQDTISNAFTLGNF